MPEELEGARLGFVGSGTITSAIVTGLCAKPAAKVRITLSPRNQQIATRLASSFPQATIAASNQEVLDRSDVIFLAVRPQIAHDVLASLKFKPDHRVISLIATYSTETIASLVAPAATVARAVPLPTVSSHLGPTAIFPPDPVAAALFGRLGVAIEVSTENEFRALAASSAAMASYFTLQDTLCAWLTQQGVRGSLAREYVAMMFRGLSEVPQQSDRSFAELAQEFTTKGGLNEQFANELTRKGAFAACSAALDSILARRIEREPPEAPT